MNSKLNILISILLLLLEVNGWVTPTIFQLSRRISGGLLHYPNHAHSLLLREKFDMTRSRQKKVAKRTGAGGCDGEENLKTDIGVLSYILGVFSSSAGLIALTKLSGRPEVIVSIIDEALGLVSLSLDTLTTFPEKFEAVKGLLQLIFGRDAVDNFLQGYGCANRLAGETQQT